MRTQTAFSLIECLITLAIVVLLAAPITHNLLQQLQQAQITQATNALQGLLIQARTQALLRKVPVTVCAGDQQCQERRDWSTQMLTFVDSNNNGQRDAGEEILLHSVLSKDASWQWRSFRNSATLTFAADGTTPTFNGTLHLCFAQQVTRKVVINRAGRSRIEALKTPTDCL